MENFYRRNLPHWQPAGANYFVTFRLADSLPKEAKIRLKQERIALLTALDSTENIGAELRLKRINKIFEKYGDQNEHGPKWLKLTETAQLLKEAIHYREKKHYALYSYTIMPNHVHLVFSLLENEENEKSDRPVTDILKSLKWYTTIECNKILNRRGSFWQPESYDHVIRNSYALQNIVYYTLMNPVNAGLVNKWKDWPHSYCKKELIKEIF